MTQARFRHVRKCVAMGVLAGLVACGGKAPAPVPGTSRGTPPDLRGSRVLVLPFQQNVTVEGDADAELAFGLADRGADVDWIFPEEIERMLARSPSIDAQTRGLPVGYFLQREVDRIGDPLFGQLRRMSALVNADVVLIPVRASFESEPAKEPAVRLTVVLIEARTGRVVWFGVAEGGVFEASDPRGLASAVDAMARRLLWYIRR